MAGKIISSKGVGNIILQTLVKRYERGEIKASVYFLDKLPKRDIGLEHRRQWPPLGCFANLKKLKNGLAITLF